MVIFFYRNNYDLSFYQHKNLFANLKNCLQFQRLLSFKNTLTKFRLEIEKVSKVGYKDQYFSSK